VYARAPGKDTLNHGPNDGKLQMAQDAGPTLGEVKLGEVKAADATVTLTERAARRISEIAANEPGTPNLRVSVEGGGCSGFQYKFDLVGPVAADDIVIEKGGAKLLIDEVSLGYLSGSEIDFVDDLMGQSFRVRNPNATASCGCGTSFTI
jgi:iron-sulfur cluster assembly accessory protein